MAASRWIGWLGGTVLALGSTLGASGGCAPLGGGWPGSAPVETPASAQLVHLPDAATTVLGGTDPELAISTSATLFERAETVIVADAGSVAGAAAEAKRLSAPVLLLPDPAVAASTTALTAELRRLQARTLVADGAAATWLTAHADELGGAAVVTEVEGVAASTPLPSLGAPPGTALTVLVTPGESAARATAEAAGTEVVELHGGDPRRDARDVETLAGRSLDHVLALGSAFGTPELLRSRLETAATGVELPGGGQVLFPGRRLVALYGHPGWPVLGVLGEQGIQASIKRAKQLAARYTKAYGEPATPTFEIITTVATGADGSYLTPVKELLPWIEAAEQAGVYVVLDLQPGRTDFLTQAKHYVALLEHPNVGLALDPEWRLAPGEHHLRDIGEVTAKEVNATGAWLAKLTSSRHLPQKLLMIHEWLTSMIEHRADLRIAYEDLAVVIHVDGFGGQGSKQQTWKAIRKGAPKGVRWGWKNFVDEDRPMLTPEQTAAQVHPAPVFISYQ